MRLLVVRHPEALASLAWSIIHPWTCFYLLGTDWVMKSEHSRPECESAEEEYSLPEIPPAPTFDEVF